MKSQGVTRAKVQQTLYYMSLNSIWDTSV